MEEHAKALSEAIEAVLPGWVERSVERIMAGAGFTPSADVRSQAAEAGRRAQADVAPRVRALLAADIDDQRSTPLALVREAVRYPTEVLRRAGVPAVERDAQQARLFPDDLYDLAPATFADLDPAVADIGLAWGAAKAYTHLQRHRPREQE
ncbi:MAG: hypothetical protein M3179_12700 [Actinomycetota bacterium]|nr:hypothetical protein [Actinomycetota bacterium]